jgi:hypothetical protein
MMAAVISTICQSVERMKLSQRYTRSIPVAIAGGSCIPDGFSELFAEVVAKTDLPFRVSGVRRAAQPLRAVSAGCLRCALESRTQAPTDLAEYAKAAGK